MKLSNLISTPWNANFDRSSFPPSERSVLSASLSVGRWWISHRVVKKLLRHRRTVWRNEFTRASLPAFLPTFLRTNGSFDFLSVAQLSALMHVPREYRENRSKESRKLDQNLSKTSRISLCFFSLSSFLFFYFHPYTSKSLVSSRGSRRCPTRRFSFRIVSCILINFIIVHSFYHLTRSREKVHGATCFAKWHLWWHELIDRLLALFME